MGFKKAHAVHALHINDGDFDAVLLPPTRPDLLPHPPGALVPPPGDPLGHPWGPFGHPGGILKSPRDLYFT